MYRGFGPTLAAEYLDRKHGIHAGRETLRGWMMEGKLWRASRQRVEKIHPWRQRRSWVGEMVQWDTSEHAWLEDRGVKLYLISMIDAASSRLHARFVLHDSTEENMRLLWSYIERYGRPVSYYTDQAGLFQTAPKTARRTTDLPMDERGPLPPTQIGRALREPGIVWIGAHSPQAKGRVERSFQTAQDRLVKGLRVAGATTLEQANAYLETEFIVWWNNTIAVVPASNEDAHRSLGKEHSSAASLSYVELLCLDYRHREPVDRCPSDQLHGAVPKYPPPAMRGLTRSSSAFRRWRSVRESSRSMARIGSRVDGCGLFLCDPVQIQNVSSDNRVTDQCRKTPRGEQLIDCPSHKRRG